MISILADLIVLVHALFVAFVAFGALLVPWKPRVAPWHLLAVAWGALVVGFGLICPLTPLENRLREFAGQEAYQGGFIEHYLLPIIYPPGLTRKDQVLLVALLIIGNAIVYTAVVVRRRRSRNRGSTQNQARREPR